MRYFVIFLILIGFAGTAFAQQTENDNNESDQFLPPPSIFYGLVKEPIKINLHQYAVIKDLNMQILFFKIIEDSRCPSDVTCVWQGRVLVQLVVATENDSKQIVLSSENTTAPINEDYSLVLIDVEPYPTSKNPIKEKDYDVRLKLERIGPNQSPLQQFKSSIPINEIQCQEEFVLVFKVSNENPACVKYGTGVRLLDRGWATCLYDKISYTRGHPCGPSSGHPMSFDKESYKKVPDPPNPVFMTRFPDGSPGVAFSIVIDDSQNIIVESMEGSFVFNQTGHLLQSHEFVHPNPHQGKPTYDSEGNYYIGNPSPEGAKIVKYSPDDDVLLEFGSDGDGEGEFSGMIDVAVDSKGNIYATDHYNDRVQVFDSDGNYILSFGGYGFKLGTTKSPTAITIDDQDNIYVASNYALQKFEPIKFE